MSRSGIRALMELALKDPEAIRLEVGEPDVPTPEHVIEAAFADAKAGHTGYTSSAGTLELRRALAEKVAAVNGLEVGPERVVVTHGAMNALMLAFQALLGPGDQLLVPDPEFPNWRMGALAAGGDVATYPTVAEDGFVPRLADIEAAITPATRAILVNSPNNPTGAVYPPALLAEIVALARVHDLWVLSDECYEAITFDAEHVSPASFDTDGRVLSFFSFSKTHAMTGWRLGYVVAPSQALAETMAQIAEATVACPSSVTQRAGLAALRGPQDHVGRAVAAYRERRDEAMATLGAAGIRCAHPAGAFYLLVDVSSAFDDGEEAALRLLAEEHVSVAPGEAFGAGAAGWVRLSLASDPEQLRTGVRKLVAFLERERAAQASSALEATLDASTAGSAV
ncbi:aminotransferase class I/II-fold pyridoxal phosphate-dependent enzyme [Actinotalea sp. M2MS4P-6]|uniref:pyridoxal phosphate-dependent aminotransferase n=1 Tax=Actinotalea sp. M2MS4P-6 TaxID=2983762 RepID=UPI0021E4B4BF|nr:aminotransferase class I/II-fold pyridoxal phosphate-dependent enzyme [Actinotalea sp. M2MS4P-6]MCV2394527.1 aminotransferase class I/II-fold pyridoxal phosphate-dependent enzyme [Actinotalea sp. M2MS4P-6]